jgi:hypothetical protein
MQRLVTNHARRRMDRKISCIQFYINIYDFIVHCILHQKDL